MASLKAKVVNTKRDQLVAVLKELSFIMQDKFMPQIDMILAGEIGKHDEDVLTGLRTKMIDVQMMIARLS